jgi:hypothetical protein
MTDMGRITTWLIVYAAILLLIMGLGDVINTGQEFVW